MPSNEQQLEQAWQEFLGGYVWHHAITLTTRWAYSPQAIGAQMEKRLVRTLALVAQRRVAWFYARDDRVGGHPHIHALLGGTNGLTTVQCQRAWKAGFSRAKVLNAEILADSNAAVRYVVKNLGRCPDNFDLSRRWIPK